MPQDAPAGWTLADNALTRTIRRADFVEALALVVEIGKVAEAANHHPDIDFRYNTVHLKLTSHSAGNTVTSKDFDLAQRINDLGDEAIRLTYIDLRRRFVA